jgi:diaminopimelate epimerase
VGRPNFTLAAIPMRGPAWETFREQPFDVGDGRTLQATALSMGNPHLVLFTKEDPERYHLEHLGPALEHHERFPERTNVELAKIADDGAIDVRVWERGVGETLACGTGACAVAVAAHEAGLAGPEVIVRFRGGPLRVERRFDGEVTLAGPVAHVFDAEVDLDELDA